MKSKSKKRIGVADGTVAVFEDLVYISTNFVATIANKVSVFPHPRLPIISTTTFEPGIGLEFNTKSTKATPVFELKQTGNASS